MEKVKAYVCIPTLNEEKHVKSVLDFACSHKTCVSFLVDGRSSDRTVEIAQSLKHENLRIIYNEDRIQSSAVNLVAQKAQEDGVEFLVRLDAHSKYESDFIDKVLGPFERREISSVVVQMETQGGSHWQDVGKVVYGSYLGNGGSSHRMGAKSGFVKHGHHAAFRVKDFVAIGGYDAEFIANEDAEFDYRMIDSGRNIWMECTAPVMYFPRETIKGTWKQFYRNGSYRLKNFWKHKKFPELRQLTPVAVVLSFGLPIVFPIIGWGALLPGAAYILIVLGYSMLLSWRSGARAFDVAFLAVVSHFGFGAGFLISTFRHLLRIFRTALWL
ncbi:glycosyltransferase [Puniceicoccaceae bacterium K14]|nr:glycosyltransferase [Puniceicoccaceae bacterium K14]